MDLLLHVVRDCHYGNHWQLGLILGCINVEYDYIDAQDIGFRLVSRATQSGWIHTSVASCDHESGLCARFELPLSGLIATDARIQHTLRQIAARDRTSSAQSEFHSKRQLRFSDVDSRWIVRS